VRQIRVVKAFSRAGTPVAGSLWFFALVPVAVYINGAKSAVFEIDGTGKFEPVAVAIASAGYQVSDNPVVIARPIVNVDLAHLEVGEAIVTEPILHGLTTCANGTLPSKSVDIFVAAAIVTVIGMTNTSWTHAPGFEID